MYVGSDDQNVYALNASTGAKLWSYATGGSVFSSPAVANGVVYVELGSGGVRALKASTGKLLWTYSTYGLSSPAVANGVVYLGSNDGNVYALNASTGKKILVLSDRAQLVLLACGGMGSCTSGLETTPSMGWMLRRVPSFGPTPWGASCSPHRR